MPEQDRVISEHGISKAMLEYLKEAEVEKFSIHFSGGSDEAYLTVQVISPAPSECDNALLQEVEQEIENAAWNGFQYSGAGDGTDYGDDYEYDLKAKTVKHSEWCHEPKTTKHPKQKFEVFDARS